MKYKAPKTIRSKIELEAIAEMLSLGIPRDEINHQLIWSYIRRDQPTCGGKEILDI